MQKCVPHSVALRDKQWSGKPLADFFCDVQIMLPFFCAELTKRNQLQHVEHPVVESVAIKKPSGES